MLVGFIDRGEDYEFDFGRREISFKIELHDRTTKYCVPLQDGAETLQGLLLAMGEACRAVGEAKCLLCSQVIQKPSGPLCACGGALSPIEVP